MKKMALTRTFLIKNKNHNSILIKIEIMPGVIFHIKSLKTVKKFYKRFNAKYDILKLEPGEVFQMELECRVSYKDVTYSYEDIKRKRQKHSQSLDDSKKSVQRNSEPDEDEKFDLEQKEPWRQCNSFVKSRDQYYVNTNDVLELNRISSDFDNSVCYQKDYFNETQGEYLDLMCEEEDSWKPNEYPHLAVTKEDISFIQTGLVTQTLTAELHLSFPSVRINPESLNFGNVYIQETSIRYFSLINLSGFPIEFRIKAKCNGGNFVAKPSAEILPSTKYNSDIGTTIAIEFKPSSPGYFKQVFLIYFNHDMEFNHYELFVCGFGTCKEKYKYLKL